jgi:hypothetical protein
MSSIPCTALPPFVVDFSKFTTLTACALPSIRPSFLFFTYASTLAYSLFPFLFSQAAPAIHGRSQLSKNHSNVSFSPFFSTYTPAVTHAFEFTSIFCFNIFILF